MEFVTVAAASLPSVPLDFQGNRDRILESIKIAKEKGATLRTGPELEVPGYGTFESLVLLQPSTDIFKAVWITISK